MAGLRDVAANGGALGARGSSAEVAAVAGVAFLLEAGPLALLSGTLPLIMMALHVYVAVSLAIWTFWRRRFVDLHFALLLTLTTAVLGPIGSAGSILAMLLSRLLNRGPASYEELQSALFPETKLNAVEVLSENLALGREQPTGSASVASFADIGTAGTSQQKQTMIGHLARRFRGEFAPALNNVLTDTDAAVRVQAGTAVAKIEKRYVERIVELERRVEAAPDDLTTLRELAWTLDDYAFNGLIDPQRQQDTRQAAVAAYRRCLAVAPADEGDRKALGRLLVRLGEVTEAEPLLAELCESDPQQDTMYWYAECLFRLGRYDALRTLFAQMPEAALEADSLPHRLAPVADLWHNTRLARR